MEEIRRGKARMISDGRSVAVLSLGPLGNGVREAIDRYVSEGGSPVLHYDMRFAAPVDEDALRHSADVADTIITVEDGNVEGGLFGIVSEYVASHGYAVTVVPLGAKGMFVPQGTQAELQAMCGNDADGIYRCIISHKAIKKDWKNL